MEGWQKRTLGVFFWQASVTKLGWFRVSQCIIAYFSLYTTGSIWGSLPLELRGCWYGYARWQKMFTCRRTVLLGAAAWGGLWIPLRSGGVPGGTRACLASIVCVSFDQHWWFHLTSIGYVLCTEGCNSWHTSSQSSTVSCLYSWELLYYGTREK